MLAWQLAQRDRSFIVIDNHSPDSASNVSSGIMNPITGRRYVKTWMADELFAFAIETYKHLEVIHGRDFFFEAPIYKILTSNEAVNDWSARCATEEYKNYLRNSNLIHLDKNKADTGKGAFEISGAYQVEAKYFLAVFRLFLRENANIAEENFSFNRLSVLPTHVEYGGIKAKRIIFAEGVQIASNPFFKNLPIVPTKGECLIINVEDFYGDVIINGDVFIMPTSNDNEYYVGATYYRDFEDGLPSERGKNDLTASLSKILKTGYTIKKHLAAIRPNTADRRPIIGASKEHPHVFVFNGMGTKGFSLAPYFANHLIEHIENSKPLMKEVDVNRLIF